MDWMDGVGLKVLINRCEHKTSANSKCQALTMQESPWPEEESEEEVFEDVANQPESLPCLSQKEEQSKKKLRVCLCPQSSYDG